MYLLKNCHMAQARATKTVGGVAQQNKVYPERKKETRKMQLEIASVVPLRRVTLANISVSVSPCPCSSGANHSRLCPFYAHIWRSMMSSVYAHALIWNRLICLLVPYQHIKLRQHTPYLGIVAFGTPHMVMAESWGHERDVRVSLLP